MRNLSMRAKLSIGFGLILILAAIVGILGVAEMRTIDAQASFVKSGLLPQLKLATDLDQNIRQAGLNISLYAVESNERNWVEAQNANNRVRTALTSLGQLVSRQPRLELARSVVEKFPAVVTQFEAGCTAVRNANQTLASATAIIKEQGPITSGVISELIDQGLLDIRQAGIKGDMAEMYLIMGYMNRYNFLYDTVESLRRGLFEALSASDDAMLQTLAEDYAEPLAEFELLRKELSQYPETEEKIQRAYTAFVDQKEAFTSVLQSRNALVAADKELGQAYQTALGMVSGMVEQSEKLNERISSDMVGSSQSGIFTISVMLGVALLVGLALTIWLIVTITGQLKHFMNAARELSAGNFDTRVDVRSGDEVGRMATHINKAFDVVVDKMLWYEAMLDAIPSPITVTDMERRWTFINRTTEETLGRRRREVEGHQCSEWGTALCNMPSCPVERLKHGELKHSLRHKDRDFAIQVSYLVNRRGEKIGHIELLSDVTELIQAQQQAKKALSQGMHEAVTQLEGVMCHVGPQIGELTERIRNAESGSMEQASRVMETATSMEEMNSTVSEVAHNAASAAEVSASTRQKAVDGATTVRELVGGIRKVQQDSVVLKTDMAALDEQAQSISRIMGVISDIADQTNLLALNAAIEAARAGEAGRGFAVVADEVRKLAEKTMASTQDVSNAIVAIQQSAEKSARQVDVAVSGIENATNMAERAGEALTEIVAMVDQAAVQVNGIATASEQQAASSHEINDSVMRVNAIAADTTSAMRAASQSVERLIELAQSVNAVMDEMKNK